jgi:hypothetical protein
VAAIYKDSTVSDWTPSSLINVPKVKPPKLSSPGNNSKQKNTLIKFKWSKPKGIPASSYYYLQITSDPTFAVVDYGASELTSTSLTASAPAPNSLATRYYWRVLVYNSKDDTWDFSDYSAVRSFLR